MRRRKGGELVKALRAAGYKGKFTATAQSESPEFLTAAGAAGDDATIMATARPRQHADAGGREVAGELQGALQARAGVRGPAGL